MEKKVLKRGLWVVIGLSLACAIPSTSAFAAWGAPNRNSQSRPAINIAPKRQVSNSRSPAYRYSNGRFYQRSFFGYIAIRPRPGITISILPFGFRTIFSGGTRYYNYDNVYYTDCPSGYVVVPAPVLNSAGAIMINVPNNNGSYTQVRLVRSNNGYIGPQGEFYPNHPTVEQLRALYGS